MKIDIHTHTKKCKSGDALTREISAEKFCETVLCTDVGIIAITNHNVFDLGQFAEIESRLGTAAQVWPGIELDVVNSGLRGHLLVIVAPRFALQFSEVVARLTQGSNPDIFTVSVENVLVAFDNLEPLYVAHYKNKRPALSDDAVDKLVTGTKRPECVIKEVTNAISAGIHISHGHSSIYGSDVHDWSKYEASSVELPDLRLPVTSFEQFCLLLKKDPMTINTVLDKKTAEELHLEPFGDGSILKIKAFNDINVVFGPKGTGKSCILRAIAKHYSDNGIDAQVYASSSDRLDELFDSKGKNLTVNLNADGINYCTNEIGALRSASEVAITSVSNYVSYFNTTNTNKNANKILLKDIDPEEETSAQREFSDTVNAARKTAEFLAFLRSDVATKKQLSDAELTEVTRVLSDLLDRLQQARWGSFSAWKVVSLLNSAIKACRTEVERKTGKPAKPTTTGFFEYAMNRIQVERHATAIIKSVDTKIAKQTDVVGSLGSNKGELHFVTELTFQSGHISDGALQSLARVKKGTQKKFVTCVRKIATLAYSDDLFQHVSELNEIEDVEEIKTVHELLLFNRYFALASFPFLPYSPSSGESSMLMLQTELSADKDVYILDEPERSLGNEYISDVIVPLIKERARSGKKLFISTHDANIAVRTLPYSSVYRCHGQGGYKTYVGNPFTNNLVNQVDMSDQLDWKQVSMKTLEGGEDAFGERGKIYGNR